MNLDDSIFQAMIRKYLMVFINFSCSQALFSFQFTDRTGFSGMIYLQNGQYQAKSDRDWRKGIGYNPSEFCAELFDF